MFVFVFAFRSEIEKKRQNIIVRFRHELVAYERPPENKATDMLFVRLEMHVSGRCYIGYTETWKQLE